MKCTSVYLGTDIVFDKGQYQPNTIEGRRLLAHELRIQLQNGSGIMRDD